MKPVFTYKQVQDALKAGYTSPLNHNRKKEDIAVVVTSSRGVPSFHDIEGVLVPMEVLQAAFIKSKSRNENAFATIHYDIYACHSVIPGSVSMGHPADYDLISDIHHHIEEAKRHGKI